MKQGLVRLLYNLGKVHGVDITHDNVCSSMLSCFYSHLLSTGRPNLGILPRNTKQNLSAPSNLHNWWVHSEFQDGDVNKMGPSTSKIWLYSHVYAFLYLHEGKNTNIFLLSPAGL